MIEVPELVMAEYCRKQCLRARQMIMGIRKEVKGGRVRFVWMRDGETIEGRWAGNQKEALYLACQLLG